MDALWEAEDLSWEINMSTVILEGNESVIVITEENPGTLAIENEAPVVVEIVETPATVVELISEGPRGPAGNVEILWGTTPEPASTAYPDGTPYFQY